MSHLIPGVAEVQRDCPELTIRRQHARLRERSLCPLSVCEGISARPATTVVALASYARQDGPVLRAAALLASVSLVMALPAAASDTAAAKSVTIRVVVTAVT